MLFDVLHDHFNGKVINNGAGVQIQSNLGPSFSILPLIGLWKIGDGSRDDWQVMRSNTSLLHSRIVTKRFTGNSVFGQGRHKTIKHFFLNSFGRVD